jgi:hypothetical protein
LLGARAGLVGDDDDDASTDFFNALSFSWMARAVGLKASSAGEQSVRSHDNACSVRISR